MEVLRLEMDLENFGLGYNQCIALPVKELGASNLQQNPTKDQYLLNISEFDSIANGLLTTT